MPRRPNRQPDQLDEAAEHVTRLLAGGPLHEIGGKLGRLIAGTQAAIAAGSAPPEQAVRVANTVFWVIGQLPQSFGGRFCFDATLIQAIAQEWSSGPVQLSAMIVPRYHTAWGHASIMMPSEDSESAHRVHLVLLPGNDLMDRVDLLSYPWLCHELGHNLLLRGEIFGSQFGVSIDEIASSIRLRGIADKGPAQHRARQQVASLLRYWSPTPDQKNWAHELAVDLIALWTCGPAYLATFQDQLESANPDPYQLDQNHPPYGVRVAMLVAEGQRLGWEEQTLPLVKIAQSWESGTWRAGRNNHYAAVTNQQCIQACAQCALRLCDEFRLPRCTAQRVEQLRQEYEQGELPEVGSDLLIAAWLIWERFGEEAFQSWEARVRADVMSEATL